MQNYTVLFQRRLANKITEIIPHFRPYAKMYFSAIVMLTFFNVSLGLGFVFWLRCFHTGGNAQECGFPFSLFGKQLHLCLGQIQQGNESIE